MPKTEEDKLENITSLSMNTVSVWFGVVVCLY